MEFQFQIQELSLLKYINRMQHATCDYQTAGDVTTDMRECCSEVKCSKQMKTTELMQKSDDLTHEIVNIFSENIAFLICII